MATNIKSSNPIRKGIGPLPSGRSGDRSPVLWDSFQRDGIGFFDSSLSPHPDLAPENNTLPREEVWGGRPRAWRAGRRRTNIQDVPIHGMNCVEEIRSAFRVNRNVFNEHLSYPETPRADNGPHTRFYSALKR